MTGWHEFLGMGGYARFVWPAFGLAALVLIGMAWQSLALYRRRRSELAALQAERPGRHARERRP